MWWLYMIPPHFCYLMQLWRICTPGTSAYPSSLLWLTLAGHVGACWSCWECHWSQLWQKENGDGGGWMGSIQLWLHGGQESEEHKWDRSPLWSPDRGPVTPLNVPWKCHLSMEPFFPHLLKNNRQQHCHCSLVAIWLIYCRGWERKMHEGDSKQQYPSLGFQGPLCTQACRHETTNQPKNWLRLNPLIFVLIFMLNYVDLLHYKNPEFIVLLVFFPHSRCQRVFHHHYKGILSFCIFSRLECQRGGGLEPLCGSLNTLWKNSPSL